MPQDNTYPLPDLFVRPDFDNGRVVVSFTGPEGFSKADWAVEDAEKTAAQGTVQGKAGEKCVFSVELPGFKPWSVNSPFLYKFRLKLPAAEVIQPFGIYKVEARGNKIFYNNREFYVKGTIRGREAHDHPNLGGAAEKDYYRKYILEAKAYGFNFIRFHSRIPSETYFQVADELGILTHVEIRKYFGKYQKERKALDDLDDKNPELVEPAQWIETVLSIRNHPSLLVYCMGNEIDHPGKNPGVKKIYDLTRSLDPCKLFLDTCGRGEYDRGYVDIDVKHMGYFCPFGRNHTMFDTTHHCGVFGSVRGIPTRIKSDPGSDRPDWSIQREIPFKFPVIAHEICHYTALRDVDGLEKKFDTHAPAQKPWWIGELKKLIRAKGLEEDYHTRMIRASKHYQMLWWKQGLEAVRKSPVLSGFHFFQVADTERYENSNSILDCFDDRTYAQPEQFMKFNADTILIADLPERCFFEKQRVEIPIFLSHYDVKIAGSGTLEWELKDARHNKTFFKGVMESMDLDEAGSRRICTLSIVLPETAEAFPMTLALRMRTDKGESAAENEWNLWLFPDRPEKLNVKNLEFSLADIDLRKRFAGIERRVRSSSKNALWITDRFHQDVFKHLEEGGDVLMLYRVPENRDKYAPLEKYYLPSTRDRFKGTIWDRGHNLGAFVNQEAPLAGFPHREFIDFQFYRLIEDADKICLDDFPIRVAPVIQGNDKASRDRFDVHKFGLSELVPEYTLRKFAYLFELKAGRGRLFVSGFNFTGIEAARPEVCAMFETLVNYMRSKRFQPSASLPLKNLLDYLRKKGKADRVRERMMTQYWQLDELPVESAKYWKDSETWLREGKPY